MVKAEKITLRVHEGSIQARYANLGYIPEPAAWHEYILTKDAKSLWERAVSCARKREGYTFNYLVTVHVGWKASQSLHVLKRNVHKITAEGALYIGCGVVSLAQMNKIAKELGWS